MRPCLIRKASSDKKTMPRANHPISVLAVLVDCDEEG